MSNDDYFRCLETAANARSEEEILRVRAEVLARWRGDPRADDLSEALYAHRERFLTGDRVSWSGRAESSRAERGR
jgi:hypothetical protein